MTNIQYILSSGTMCCFKYLSGPKYQSRDQTESNFGFVQFARLMVVVYKQSVQLSPSV
jgi:hypothetical protein